MSFIKLRFWLWRALHVRAFLFQPLRIQQSLNPVCGDEVTLALQIKDDVIKEIGIDVQGCALCEAGAGLFAKLALSEHTERLTSFIKNYHNF